MPDSGRYDELLGARIASCQEAEAAFKDTSHPCNKIVNWQKTELPVLQTCSTLQGSTAHRPEAWAGNLADARILFLGSNPSFNNKEIFPDYTEEWSGEKLRDFAARRFMGSSTRPFGANDGPNEAEKDRVYLKDGNLHKSKVTHWNELRGNAAAILGIPKSEVSPNKDYAMTELVHCKSKAEVGVEDALHFCSQKYLEEIFRTSNAKLIFVLGSTPGRYFYNLYPGMPKNWGYWKTNGVQHGIWPTSNEMLSLMRNEGKWSAEDQLHHAYEMELGGKLRLVIWYPRPGRPQWPRKMTGENGPIDHVVMKYWRDKLNTL